MAKIGLSSPWVLFYREISAMFEKDNSVRVVFDEDTKDLKLYVEDADKVNALTELLPSEKTFGNVTVKIEVIPANCVRTVKVGQAQETAANLLRDALKGNLAVSFIKTVNLMYSNTLTYIVFENRVVQYFTDDLGDYYGLRSTLYENLARDVFGKKEGVFFCTDRGSDTDGFCNPVGEWP